jgi:Putative DNA-binding domain
MLPLEIDEVTVDHIAALVKDRVSERRILDYKEALPGGTDEEKKEFLSDVCSFANFSGGDIIYGVRDERGADGRPTGVPESIVGLTVANISTERARLESMVRDGIKPRIPDMQTKDIQVPEHGPVLLLRVGISWIKPHMVTFKGASRFYSRHSTGKYQLDVEIGQAFAEQRSLGEQLRNWRTDRISRHLANDGSTTLDGPSKLLLHFVPAAALGGQQTPGLWKVPADWQRLIRPSSLTSGISWRYNADGFLVHSTKGTDGWASYVQVFRNGCLEYGDGYILNVGLHYGNGKENVIPSKSLEEKLVATYANGIQVLNALGIDDPVYFSCTLIGVEGLSLSQGDQGTSGRDSFDRPIIQTPDVRVDRGEESPYCNSLLTAVDSIWQASGYEETPWLRNWGLDSKRRPTSREQKLLSPQLLDRIP